MSDSKRVASVPKKKHGLLRAMAWIFGILIVLLGAIFFVATSSAFFKGTILPRVGKAINAQITVSNASISPFKHVTLRDLKVKTTGTEPLVTAAEVRLRYSLMDIIRGNIRVDEVTVASLTVALVEHPDGSSNLDPILKSLQTKEPKSKSAASAKTTPPSADVLICLPATLVARAVQTAAGRIAIGGEDCSTEIAGAFTGDLSAEMLKDAGASAVIVGHSERRQHHGETDAIVAAKAIAARRAGLLAIICIGETHAQRLAGNALSVCGDQIAGSVPEGMTSFGMAIGYEPLWAIGSGHMPTPAEIIEVHAQIRQCLIVRLGAEGQKVRILYGGSVKPPNARTILALPEVGGVLVGGASLKAADFERIFRAIPHHEATGSSTDRVPNHPQHQEQP